MVTSECVEQFRELDACEQGAPQAPTPATKESAAPAGWQRISDSQAGFAIHLPEGAKIEQHRGHRTWTATSDSGVIYRVAVLPALNGAATEKALMHAIIHYLGHQCQPGVRLHGRFETAREVAERFDGRCANGEAWHGIARASKDHLVLVSEVVPPGKEPMGDAYYYSFEYLD